jgi:hypothetical protein
MSEVVTLPRPNLLAANLIIEIETIARTEDTLHNRVRNALDRWATASTVTVAPGALLSLKKTLRERIQKVHDNPDDYSPRVIEVWNELSDDI